MMARYRKIDLRIHADARFRNLSPMQPSGQALWYYLLTAPESSIIPGVLVGFPEGMAARLRWPAKAFLEAFAEVLREGMAEADWKAGMVWLPQAPKHNAPQSPNVITSWHVVWDEVPECALKLKAWKELKAFSEGIGEAFGKAFAKAMCKPMANQEQEQEQEQEKNLAAEETPPPASSPPADPPKRRGRPPKDPDAAPELPLVCTRQQALDAIAGASAGRFVASQPDRGGAFKLDRLRRDPDALAKCSAIGRWLAAGGDAWRGNLDGRALGANLDAWLAQSSAWDGTPVTGGRTRRPSELDVPDWSKEGAF